MRQWSLLLTGIFVSTCVVVPTQVKAQKKPVQVQKLAPMNTTLFLKLVNAANTAVFNCYNNNLVHECTRFHRIQNIFREHCVRGNKPMCKLWAEFNHTEMLLQTPLYTGRNRNKFPVFPLPTRISSSR